MADRAVETQPRIALVFGEAAAAVHVREAVAGHAEIAYASAAADFDADRLASTGATSALINLDGGDWLDRVESALNAVGIAVVYNDPEISQSLEGWARARWVRHLVAKLRGSRDVDPPRPESMSRFTATEPVAAVADAAGPQSAAANAPVAATAVEAVEPAPSAGVVELPLSPEEIETMTVDFVGAQIPPPAAGPVAEAAHGVPESGTPSLDGPAHVVGDEDALSFEPALESPTEGSVAADESSQGVEHAPSSISMVDAPTDASVAAGLSLEADASGEQPAPFDFEAEAALDVDTEALSAMIDARLAEPESAQSRDPTQVWREVSGDSVPAAEDQVCEAQPMTTQDTPLVPSPAPAATADDDADVLASLPSLDDWALVDPDAAPPAAVGNPARKPSEPVLSDAFAGLELVPMETVVPLRVDADPIERWFGGDSANKAGANDAVEPGIKEASHEHG